MKKTDSSKYGHVRATGFIQTLFSKEGVASWLVLAIGVLLTIFISVSIESRNTRNAEARFTLLSDNLAKQINDRLRQHESVLLAGAGLFDAQSDISREQWQTFIERLSLEDNYPGIQGVGFAKVIKPEQLATHIEKVREQGFPDYRVRPDGERELYTSIVFLEPFTDRNLAAFGYDMFSEPTRRDAMQRAVTENKTQISGKITLVQETHGEQQAGFLMYVPIFQRDSVIDTEAQRWRALKGFVYSPYRMGDLMRGIFNGIDLELEFSLYDGNVRSKEALLFTSSTNEYYDTSSLEHTHHLEAYGNTWILHAFSQPSFKSAFNSPADWLVPSFSLIITLLLATILLQFKRRNAQATRLAEAMSEDLMRSERFIHMVLESASTLSIVATDIKGIITVFNKGAENMLGYSRDELVGKHSPAIIHEESEVVARAKELSTELDKPVEGFQVFVEKPLQVGMEQKEWTYIRKDGERLQVSLTVTAIRDERENLIGFLGVAEDISERKRIEEMKNQFISTVSHELRTPLTSISGALDLVMTNRFGMLNDKGASLLANAHRNSKRLCHLINDLLDIEKIADGSLHFDIQAESLNELLGQSVEGIEHYAQERQVKVALELTDEDATIFVDKQRFTQVMANLLSNAIKFSPQNERVLVSWHIDNDKVVVQVIDHGPGIPKDFENKIFKRFSQADSKDNRGKGGSGLGLAICRELLERMQGHIDFESTEGKGSRFYFQLPLRQTKSVTTTKVPAQSVVQQPRILVLEDEPDVADLIATMLNEAGYRVDIAFTGEEALSKLQKESYDLLTVDLMLPDMHGLEVIQQVKSAPETSDMPVVVLSAIAKKGQLSIQGSASNTDWLAKPIQQERLLGIISERLKDLSNPIQTLHIEDDYDLHQVISAMADKHFNVVHASSVQEARTEILSRSFDAIILDIGLPDGSGWELLPDIQQHQPQAYIMILSGQNIDSDSLKQVDMAVRKSNLNP